MQLSPSHCTCQDPNIMTPYCHGTLPCIYAHSSISQDLHDLKLS